MSKFVSIPPVYNTDLDLVRAVSAMRVNIELLAGFRGRASRAILKEELDIPTIPPMNLSLSNGAESNVAILASDIEQLIIAINTMNEYIGILVRQLKE